MLYYKFLRLESIYYFCEIDYIFKTEQWKDVVGYEGLYQVSDLGRVKSLDRLSSHYQGGFSRLKGRFMIQSIARGYAKTSLTLKGKTKCIGTHRLVGMAFIDNPENKPQINHVFGNKLDNRSIVLEWSTNSENIKHAHRTGLHKGSHYGLKGYLSPTGKAVLQYDLKGNFIKEYPTLTMASQETKIFHQNIMCACKGKYKQAKGFIWKYKNE